MMGTVKVLIVEDEVITALQMKRQLERAGYIVYGPEVSGEDAIAGVKKNEPDVVLMDIRLMGNMDGIEAARMIGSFSSAIIIFTTGYQDTYQKKRALELNPAGYLIKPVKVSDIRAIIEAERS